MTETHATSTLSAGPQMRLVEVALIEESPHNPRKTFDPAKLQELADSIAASGVHQPILLRPLPASRVQDTFAQHQPGAPLPAYELVAGARRLRACKMAKVLEVPAMIRELSDTQALEIQVIENLQREDVTELEEAEGYEVLMRTGSMNADQLGAKIGKSRSYVYARLKVLDLCAKGREALRKGSIDFSRGLLIARIPDEALQIKALKFCTEANYEGDLPGYRECARYVQDEFMLRLDKARFNIADSGLLPGVGPCQLCPKRTGANPDLFADVKSADVCTDPKCYHAKEEAHTAALVAQAEAQGHTVIAGKEADELRVGGYEPKLKGYKRLDAAEDSPTDQPLRKIIGKQMQAEGIRPVKIEDPRRKGEFLDALPNEVVLRLLKAVEGQAKATQQVAKEVRQFADDKKAKALAKATAKYEQAWRDGVLDRAWQGLPNAMPGAFSREVHRYVLLRELHGLSQEDALTLADSILGLGKVAPLAALIEHAEQTPEPALLHLLVIMQRDSGANHYRHNRPKNEGLMLVAGNVFGEGLAEVVTACQKSAAAEHLPSPEKPAKAAKPVKTAAPETTSTPTPAAQAGGVRGGVRGRKGARPASAAPAPAATEQPLTSKAHASAQIAAALQAAEADIQAPAAQGNEGAPAPAGGCAGDAAPSNTAGAFVPSAAWPLQPPASNATAAHCAAAPTTNAGADANTGAAIEPASALAIGVQVRVLPTANGPKQAPHVGKHGTIARQIGNQAWDVAIPREKRRVPLFVAFHSSELEVVL